MPRHSPKRSRLRLQANDCCLPAPAAAVRCFPKCSLSAGAAVTQIVVYESRDVEKPNDEVLAAMHDGRIDWTTVTSSAIARSLVRMFGEDLRHTRLAAISPLTAEVLAELGHPASAIAEIYTGDGMIDAILAAEGGKL